MESGARRRAAHLAHEMQGMQRARTEAERTKLVYFKQALLHPWHLLVLAVATVSGVLCWSWMVPLFLIVFSEIVVLSTVPKLGAFRRYVDLKLEQAERAVAAEARATLLQRMEKEHRHELERLESLSDKIRERVRLQGTSTEVGDDWLGLSRLTACYVPLAIAYRASKECLAATDREGLEQEIRALRATRNVGPERLRGLADRRLEVAERRAAQWDRSRMDLDAISAELALISGIVHLTHEQCAAPVDLEAASDEIDRIVANLEENEGTLRELATLYVVDQEVEPRVLEMGRDRPGSPRPRPHVVWQPRDGGFIAREELEEGRPRIHGEGDVFYPDGRTPSLA